MSNAADIVVDRLTKNYGSFLAVDHISFEVPKGVIVGFLGPNGAGKTTTIRMLTCYMPPTSGTATVAGHDVFLDSLNVRRNIGYLPESTPLYTEMRIREYLDFKARLRGLNREERRKAIAHAADRTWLTDRLESVIGHLSKGYRQRVGIADALLHNPRVLVLDEPTVGLDPSQIREARKLISELAGDHTVLLSTHILQEVEMVCQRVIIVARGQIVAQGTPEELKNKAGSGVRVEVRGPSDQVKSALSTIAGVEKVDVLQSGAVSTVNVRGKNSPEMREQIAGIISQRGWALREMRQEGASLEEFFVRITDPGSAAA
ncbi:MAG TPA: ATP-binding cassette domain-containing protein [Phycisphaerae bacterium]|nr:ATP-binding cassette domain-containing protein [Phycisphaerae bacterium]